MRSRPARESEGQAARFERRFGLKMSKLPGDVRRAVEILMAEIDLVSVEHAALAEKLLEARTLADRDTLTPVFNRRAFMEELGRVVSYVERYKTEAAILFIDMNGFKALNDAFGHAVGDAALCHVARLLLQNIRESDVVGRVGGDEFAVALVNVGPDEARRKADALARAIAETPLVMEGVRHRLTASVGCSPFSAAGGASLKVEALLSRADEAMYAAKFAERRRAEAR
jgi:diguanylate cyclase (GGDEF)-like protein